MLRYWFEKLLILPLKLLYHHYRDVFNQEQMCKNCGKADGFNFDIDDNFWKLVVPDRYQERVLCLRCFDMFCANKGLDYATYLKSFYFASNIGGVNFEIKPKKE